MIDHLGIHVADFAKSKAFYDAVFAALGGSMLMQVPVEYTAGKGVIGYGRAEVDAFYAAAMASGGRDNGGPGPRPQYHADYYGAFVIDPDGNNIEAVCHFPERRDDPARS
jgi:catechol 2,3-dioxygenase-like lactoylglutathione lyase family enzyme